jgi:lysyl-tRNA synthetase, class I
MTTENHWSEKIAESLIQKHPNQIITCASGISPSGHIHIGNLREIMTTEFVVKTLSDNSTNVDFLFSWDDFDRFRKIPYGFPESMKDDVGKPYSAIKDPFGEFDSYASRFIEEFETSLKQLNIKPRFIRQSQKYSSGEYKEDIKHCLEKRIDIANILARNMTQGMSDEQITNFFPIQLYSRFTGKDNTQVLNWDGTSKVEYLCRDTNKRDILDLDKDFCIKLPWKIDWPMRWKKEEVLFEPGGPDHASPGSSYDVSSQISREIFGFEPPSFQEYGFIRIKGENGKMSSSKGNIITPEELLKVYSPAMIKWIYGKTHPSSQLDVALDKDVIKNYAEFDEFLRNENSSLFYQLIEQEAKTKNNIPFRQIFGLGEATNYDISKIEQILSQENSDFDRESVKDRLEKSNYWSKTYYPEGRSIQLNNFNRDYYTNLPEDRKNQIRKLQEVISRDNLSIEELETAVYAIPKREEMTNNEKKIAQRQFFKDTYNLLFGKDQGPRLPTYFWANEGNQQIKNLLSNE